jgi:hypothetical protein
MAIRLRFLGATAVAVVFGACSAFQPADEPLAPDGGAAGAAEAGPESGGPADGAAAIDDAGAVHCDVTKPFTSNLPLVDPAGQGVGAPASAYSPTLSADESVLYFAQALPNSGSQIVRSARSGNAFEAPEVIPAIPSLDRDMEPSLRIDGTQMVFLSDRDAPAILSPLHFFSATRAAAGGFGAPAPLVVDFDASAAVQSTPFLSADGMELYFASTLAGTLDLYRARATLGGAFGAPARINTLSSPGGEDLSPVLSADGLTIYFASDRLSAATAIKTIWVARRSSTAGEFDLPTIVEELHDETIDRRPGWISPDSCRLYFAAPAGDARFGIFVAARKP